MPELIERIRAAVSDRYRIERELGEGGMATVYLAEDLKHDRKVAVKVLKPELAAVIGAERFLNEIKVTANLQHPNILALYDSGEADTFLYYVMPFIDGESLRDRLDRETQLSVDDATAITESVAAALDYAHRQGVVHRDIKPANILLHEGQALVADFGIALALSHAGSRLTETGLSVGTPHYMSPEQAMGDRELDGRSDIYSLGCVTYEMLVGEPPHTGPSAQAIVAKIVTDVPRPVTDARPSTPESLAAAVEKALEKLPADRFRTADEFGKALTSPTPITRSRATPRSLAPLRSRILMIAALAIITAFFIGRFTGAQPEGTDTSSVARFTIPTPEGSIPGNTVNGYIAISRDGQRVAYALALAATDAIFVRHLSSLTATPVAGTIEAGSQVFSPDGQSLVYQVTGGDIFVTRLDGGTRERIASNGIWDLAWEADGSILMGAWLRTGGVAGLRQTAFRNSQGVLRLPPGGGEPELLTTIDTAAGEAGHYFPQLLPGGEHLLIALEDNPYIGGVAVAVIDRETEKRTILVPNATRAKYVPSGHLVWAEDNGRLRASAFDVDALELTGPIITIAEDVQGASLGGWAQFDVSDRGDIIYVPATPRELVKIDRAGRVEPLTNLERLFHSPRVSPDGRRIAVDITDQDGRFLWVLDAVDGTLQKVTFEGSANDPVWTPDGSYISFGLSINDGTRGVYRVLPDGSASPELILQDDDIARTPGSWFPDGDSLIAIGITPSGWSLTVIGREGGTSTALANTRPQHAWPAISPDGQWLAYTSDDGGIPEVYVRPIDGTGRTLVSREGGTEPVWHPSGREIFYRHARGSHEVLMAARFEPGSPPRIIDRTELFGMNDVEVGSPHANYDIFPDGEHFVAMRIEGGTEIVYVENWTALFDKH